LQGAFPATYALDREIGRGGMATVFLARDVRYDRRVAVKVLNPELGAVLGVERFLSEIRVTATLQHPNLLPLFDSGEANGLLYYVMPFVEGETLRTRLEREKQLPVGEVVRLGSAIASALDYAHRNGVIHRDLKPENILLQDGQPLVADFGIALAVSNAGGARVTQTGLSLGTPQYMSPEQATGDRAVDARSDVYALGAILYECLTGEAPHTGTTAQAIIARLMTEEPRAIAQTRKSVPPALEDVVMRALNKLPADRFGRAEELGNALQASLTAPNIAPPTLQRAESRWRAAWFGGVGLLVGAAGATVAALAYTRALPAPSVRFSVQVPDSIQVEPAVGLSLAVSPDGQSLAFLGRSPSGGSLGTGLYVRTLDDEAARLLPNTGLAANPVFSPDGKDLVYFDGADSQYKRLSVNGGVPTSFRSPVGGWLGEAWGYGDYFVYAGYKALTRISRDGQQTQIIATTSDLGPKVIAFTNPAILPDGRTVAARAIVDGKGQLAIASVDSGRASLIDLEIANVVGYYDGTLFFGRLDGTINAVPFDIEKRRVLAAPQTVLQGVSVRTEGGVNAMLARNGTLAFLRGQKSYQLVVSDERGNPGYITSEQPYLSSPAWSPDGRRLAVDRRQDNSSAVRLTDVWLHDLETTAWTRVTSGYGVSPVWLPDGRSLAFEGGPLGSTAVMTAPLDGTSKGHAVARQGDQEPSFDASGRVLVVSRRDSASRASRLVRVPLDGASPDEDLLDAGVSGRSPRVSPDGKWLAYVGVDDADAHVYVKPLRSGGGRVQISLTSGANSPRWGRRTNALYYLDGRTVRRAALNFAGDLPTVVRRDSLWTMPSASPFDVSPDEQRFAYVRESKGNVRPYVFTNWAREIVAKMSGK
jgi:serine/threonine-protein kinase